MILRKVRQTHEVGVNAAEHWETSCEIRKKPKRKNNNRDIDRAWRDPLRDLLEWFRSSQTPLCTKKLPRREAHAKQLS